MDSKIRNFKPFGNIWNPKTAMNDLIRNDPAHARPLDTSDWKIPKILGTITSCGDSRLYDCSI